MAVGEYIAATSPRYPVDPYSVAINGHLRPILWAATATGAVATDAVAVSDVLLIDPTGAIYADPISVAAQAVYPASITKIALRGHREFLPPMEALARMGDDIFISAPGSFPVTAVWCDAGSIVVRQADNSWISLVIGVDACIGPACGSSDSDADISRKNVRDTPVLEGTRPVGGTSVSKGSRGERRVYDVLARKAGYVIRDVSHRARSADLLVEAPGCRIFVDAKDYAIAVPDKEVQKFRRDLGARGADAGVLVSLSSGIVGIKGTLAAVLEALPAEGRIVPVVYAASGHEDVISAAVDLATHLARVHPDTLGITVLHPRDALEAYVAGLEEVSDLFEDARAELKRLASTTAAGFGSTLEKLGHSLRDQRRLIRAQRGAIESCDDVVGADSNIIYDFLSARYPIPEAVAVIMREILRALATPTGLGDIRTEARWRCLKAKAVYISSEAFFSFLRTRTDFGCPLSQLSQDYVAMLLTRHPKKVRIADEVLSLELDDATAIDAIEIASAC